MIDQVTHKEIAPGTVVFTLTGKLMMGRGGEPMLGQVEDLLRQGKRIFIFDLSGVTAIDSTGIGRFIASFNKITAAGGDLRMAGATGHVFDAFHVSLLDTVFRFFDSVEAAASA